MRARTAISLILLGALVLGAAVMLRPSDDQNPAGAGQLVFPGLAANLPKATRISISASGKQSTLVLKGDTWGLEERDGYPVLPAKLRELLAGLAELKLVEPRTADPAQFGRLGVDDPKVAGSTAAELKVQDASGTQMVDLLLGHRRTRSQGGLPEAVYIRKPAETQSWLAEGQVPADGDPQSWLVRDLTDIPPEKIAKMVDVRGDSTLTFTKDGDRLALNPPAPFKLDEYHLDETARALSGLTLVDVKAGKLPGTALGSSAYTTTDGLIVTVSLSKDGAILWAAIAATGKGAEPYARLANWAFQISDWREKALLPTLAELKAAEPEKTPTPTAPVAPPAAEPPAEPAPPK